MTPRINAIPRTAVDAATTHEILASNGWSESRLGVAMWDFGDVFGTDKWSGWGEAGAEEVEDGFLLFGAERLGRGDGGELA